MTEDITPELLLHAYSIGIFPMAERRDDQEVFWVDPTRRGILPLDGFHISRSLARRMRKGDFEVTINRDFDAVVKACAAREETWINATIFELYRDLHARGFAHSLEVRRASVLVGGVYGVALGGAFFGESMFSFETDMSKIALAYLVDRLRQTGFVLFDVQFLTEHLASLGAIEISREVYQAKLTKALEVRGAFSKRIDTMDPYCVVQRNTQTS